MPSRNSNTGGSRSGKHQERGFAAMNEQEQREIARKGGEAVSEDRGHMSEIGRKGAEARNEERDREGHRGSSGSGGGNKGGR